MKKINLENILKYSLALLLFLLPWQTIWITQERFLNGTKWEYGTLGFYATEFLLWACVILFIIWYWERVRLKIKDLRFSFTKDRIFLLFCLLTIVYSLLTTVWALDSSLAFQRAFHILEAFLLFFMLYLGPINFKTAAKWFVAGAVLQSLLGIWQFLSQFTFEFKWLGLVAHPVAQAGTSIVAGEGIGRVLRAYGAFSHPNVFGGYLVISFIMTYLLFCKEKIGRLKDWKIKDLRLRLALYFILYTLQLIALFFTFSRSAWLAFLIVTLLHCYIVFKNKFYKKFHILYSTFCILTFVIIAILTTIYFPVVKTRFSGQSTHEIQSTTERVSGYREAFTIFKQHPWLGVGIGNYTAAVYALDSSRPGWEYQPVHSAPLLILVEVGIIGVLLLLGVVVSFIRYQISDIRYQKANNKKQFWILLLSAICYLPLVLFDHYLFSSYIGLLMSAVYFGLILRFLQTKNICLE